MVKAFPFKAVRPHPKYAPSIAALPYDVVSHQEAKENIQINPLSFLRVDRPDAFFSAEEDPYQDKVYHKAKDELEAYLVNGHMIQDNQDQFYLYRLNWKGKVQNGLVACFSIDSYIDDSIKKHELTRPEKEIDRIRHMEHLQAHTGPIFLTYRHQPNLQQIFEQVKDQPALYDFISEDGIGHTVWTINNPQLIKDIQKNFEALSALYIADGHHRTASAIKVGLKERQKHPSFDGQEGFNYFLGIAFSDQEVQVLDYNRHIKDLNGLTTEGFLKLLEEKFEIQVQEKQRQKPNKTHQFSLYLQGKWYSLSVKETFLENLDHQQKIDAQLLEDLVLKPILNIQDIRTSDRIDFIGGIHGLKRLEDLVNESGGLAFALYPVQVQDIMTIADHQLLMPAKSTWFEPKLRSGLFIHPFQD